MTGAFWNRDTVFVERILCEGLSLRRVDYEIRYLNSFVFLFDLTCSTTFTEVCLDRISLFMSRFSHGVNIDFYTKVRQHERLFGVLLAHEVETANSGTSSEAACQSSSVSTWEGDLCGAAQTLLHQHAVQGDLSSLQAAIARFAAACRLNSEAPLDPKWDISSL